MKLLQATDFVPRNSHLVANGIGSMVEGVAAVVEEGVERRMSITRMV